MKKNDAYVMDTEIKASTCLRRSLRVTKDICIWGKNGFCKLVEKSRCWHSRVEGWKSENGHVDDIVIMTMITHRSNGISIQQH